MVQEPIDTHTSFALGLSTPGKDVRFQAARSSALTLCVCQFTFQLKDTAFLRRCKALLEQIPHDAPLAEYPPPIENNANVLPFLQDSSQFSSSYLAKEAMVLSSWEAEMAESGSGPCMVLRSDMWRLTQAGIPNSLRGAPTPTPCPVDLVGSLRSAVVSPIGRLLAFTCIDDVLPTDTEAA